MKPGRISRRGFLALAMIAGCGRTAGETGNPSRLSPDRARARLSVRHHRPSRQGPKGLRSLGLAPGARDGLIYVPAGYAAERPARLALMLHGGGGSAPETVAGFERLFDATNTIVVSPDSRGGTWDILLGGFGPDVAFIDQVLEWTFDQYVVDRSRVAIGGFSNGASYALSLGPANGDFFTHVIAFSPGFMEPPELVGRPKIFVSHGTGDRVLPIDVTSRFFVPKLEGARYEVRYREFQGGHAVPDDVAREALEWFTAS